MIILIIHIIWPEYFIDFFMWKMDPMSGFGIRLVFTLPPRDSTLQYKRCVHFWNNFPCIAPLLCPVCIIFKNPVFLHNNFIITYEILLMVLYLIIQTSKIKPQFRGLHNPIWCGIPCIMSCKVLSRLNNEILLLWQIW